MVPHFHAPQVHVSHFERPLFDFHTHIRETTVVIWFILIGAVDGFGYAVGDSLAIQQRIIQSGS